MLGVLRGPELFRVRTLEEAIAAGTLAAPTLGTARPFRWPRPLYVESMFVMLGPANGVGTTITDASLAGVELAITDQHDRAIVSDGRQSMFVPALALVGRKKRWFPIGIEVAGNDTWVLRFQRVSGGADVAVPQLFFRIREIGEIAA